MKRWERWTFNTTALVVAVSGFAYLWMKYFIENPDPFAVVNHPWQSAMLQLHVLVSPAFILVLGIILNSHVLRKLGASPLPNRKSGLITFVLAATMVCSGYLLQVTSDQGWLRVLVVLHAGSGALFSVTYVIHLVVSVRLTNRWRVASAVREVA